MESLGIAPLINAAGSVTPLSASPIAANIAQAMATAAQSCVDIAEAQGHASGTAQRPTARTACACTSGFSSWRWARIWYSCTKKSTSTWTWDARICVASVWQRRPLRTQADARGAGTVTPSPRQARIDLAATLRWAARLGYQQGVCNHFSLLAPHSDEFFLVNPEGLFWSEVTAGGLLLCDLDGTVVERTGTVELPAVLDREEPDYSS